MTTLFASEILIRYLNPQLMYIFNFSFALQYYIEFDIQFCYGLTYSQRHVILRWPAKFYPNRTVGGRVMTSYRFFKVTAYESEIYFWDQC